ncbi:MAG TPA: ABC-F family ATP-binding cassette domain-containing protein [Pseudonocardia sp.]|jgi:ATP-binding cassette subfamily F protein uup|nr:ABC-F family ATP-binding cassette domain-containing protein [Pseudonocardia sp.]
MADQNLINCETVTVTVPGDASRVLLDRVSLGVSAGERIGVVGLNGGGKTTLLEVLTGVRDPDSGRVSRLRNLRIASVEQHTVLPAGVRVRDVVLGALGVAVDTDEHEWAGSSRVRTVLAGLGITDLDRTVDGLSGGERRRVTLAAALVSECDLIVLDEPTNHLDVEGINWLAEHLIARRVALVVVTHDRWFLDTVCTQTWEVGGFNTAGQVESYLGGYADWVYARAERTRQADTAEERRRNLARKELAWLRRGAPARTSKPRFRIEAAEELIAGEPEPRNTPELMAFASARLGRQVLEVEDATLTVPDRTLLDRVTWRLGPGDRIGLVGVNGSGKTTLLRALSGERALEAGRLITGKTVRLAHLTQELVDLPADLRVLEAVEQINRFVVVGKAELSASSMLERLGFPAARQWTPVGDLSGGERRRLQLTRLLMGEPNVLILDEPTNDLDIDTLQRLEDLLDGWPGTLIVVSHDRYLIERVCDTVVALFGDGRITHLPGGIQEYLDRRVSALANQAPTTTHQPKPKPKPADGPSAAQRRDAQKDARRLERRMETLSERETRLHTELAEAATDPKTLLELDAQLRAVVAERAQVEEEWLLAAETAEG